MSSDDLIYELRALCRAAEACGLDALPVRAVKELAYRGQATSLGAVGAAMGELVQLEERREQR